nr:MAG TPA: hypothetical protein [Caudoviricetes sp.]
MAQKSIAKCQNGKNIFEGEHDITFTIFLYRFSSQKRPEW